MTNNRSPHLSQLKIVAATSDHQLAGTVLQSQLEAALAEFKKLASLHVKPFGLSAICLHSDGSDNLFLSGFNGVGPIPIRGKISMSLPRGLGLWVGSDTLTELSKLLVDEVYAAPAAQLAVKTNDMQGVYARRGKGDHANTHKLTLKPLPVVVRYPIIESAANRDTSLVQFEFVPDYVRPFLPHKSVPSLMLRCGSSRTHLSAVIAPLPEHLLREDMVAVWTGTVEQAELYRLTQATAFCSTSESTPVLQAIQFMPRADGFTLTSSDGYALATSEGVGTFVGTLSTVLIPFKQFQAFVKGLKATSTGVSTFTLYKDGTFIGNATEGGTPTEFTLDDGRYATYGNVISGYNAADSVDIPLMIRQITSAKRGKHTSKLVEAPIFDALETAMIYGKVATFEVSACNLIITAKSVDLGDSESRIALGDMWFKVRMDFNLPYIRKACKALKQAGATMLTFTFTADKQAVKISGDTALPFTIYVMSVTSKDAYSEGLSGTAARGDLEGKSE